MLTLKNVSKNFGPKTVLTGIDLRIDNGTIVGLLGPNGAGKTTLMRLITGFYGVTEGEIIWDEKIMGKNNVDIKRNIGYLPENNPLYLNMTTAEFLEFVYEMKSQDKSNKQETINTVAEKCNIKDVLTQKIETLSKGYRQRVGFAAAIMNDPKLLILDEPTSGLDPNQILEMRSLIKKLSKDKTIIFSTHILPEAAQLCDRLIIINKGKIALDEKTSQIKNIEKKFVQLTSI